jgi:hypothetical protein
VRRDQFSLIKLKYIAKKFLRFFPLPLNFPQMGWRKRVEGEKREWKNYWYGEVSCAYFFIAPSVDIHGLKTQNLAEALPAFPLASFSYSQACDTLYPRLLGGKQASSIFAAFFSVSSSPFSTLLSLFSVVA